MSASFYDLLKYAKTGIASPGMTAYDKMRAVAMAGGKVKTLTGVPPFSFTGNGKPLISWSMLGNSQQNGTPSPDNIIMPEFCGKLVGTDWIIPITCAGQTVPVYLGQVSTVRRVRKLVLDGTEKWRQSSDGNIYIALSPNKAEAWVRVLSTHFTSSQIQTNGGLLWLVNANVDFDTVEECKTYLAAQYAAGHPVTIWYVLKEPETAIVNEPLAKIGNYADELHSDDAGVSIPTAKGANTLTVDTGLQPSSMTITYCG